MVRTLEAATPQSLLQGPKLMQIILGAVVCILNIGIHALVMTSVVSVAEAAERRTASLRFLGLAAVMSATVLVLMAAHTLEVLVWALGVRDLRGGTGGHRSRLLRLRQLRDAWIWRHRPSGRLAAVRPDHRDERGAAFRLVDGRHLRSPAQGDARDPVRRIPSPRERQSSRGRRKWRG